MTAVFPWARVNAIYRLSNQLTFIVREGAFSRIIPQGILEMILFLGGTVCPLQLENVNLFRDLDPAAVEQPAKFK